MMDHFEIISGGREGPRAGRLVLPSGKVASTPFFMPVATKLSVKTLSSQELERTGTEVVITNGFLTSLEPGSPVVRSMGGIKAMMGFQGGVFSDSGGFQFIRKGFDPRVDDEGVHLRSPYSGEKMFLRPEGVVDFHVMHGVDVGMVLDHCPPFPSTPLEVMEAARRTVLWARRSQDRILEPSCLDGLPVGAEPPLLYGITQGGTDIDLREGCTKKLLELDLPGYGIGGLSIGESKDEMFSALTASTRLIPWEKPRYFMGVGEPSDIIKAVLCGVDIFDSVFPTRNARHRSLFTMNGRENIRAGGFKGVEDSVMDGCPCMACRDYSRGYLFHLFKAGEPLGPRLATIHNITFIQMMMAGIGVLIKENSLNEATKATEAVSLGMKKLL